MLRRAPSSTPFPTRRSSDLAAIREISVVSKSSVSAGTTPAATDKCLLIMTGRSEEHTSELQSHSDLVCRLLLEKQNLEREVNAYTSLQKTIAAGADADGRCR